MIMTTTPTLYTLPDLPYSADALQPVVSAQIMELHHAKHHATYVKQANELTGKLIELAASDDPSPLIRALSFNLSGHVMHSLFWTSMTPNGSSPSTELAEEITSSFGSIEAMKKRMAMAATKLSGSGWAVLSWDSIGQRLQISQVHDHQGEVMVGTTPLLVLDVWEHAYYLDYKSDRAAWAQKFFDIADWTSASSRFDDARRVARSAA